MLPWIVTKDHQHDITWDKDGLGFTIHDRSGLMLCSIRLVEGELTGSFDDIQLSREGWLAFLSLLLQGVIYIDKLWKFVDDKPEYAKQGGHQC